MVLCVFLGTDLLMAKPNWSILSSATYSTGTYTNEQKMENYYLNVGIRYRVPTWSVTLSLPFHRRDMEPSTNPQLTSDAQFDYAPADLYLYGEHLLWRAASGSLRATFASQVKIPTGIGNGTSSTGKADVGANLVLRWKSAFFNAFGDVGFLALGDSPEIDYANPFGIGFGLSRYFSASRTSISIYTKGYSRVLPDTPAPRQVTYGFYQWLSSDAYLFLNIADGLSKGSPDLGLSLGMTAQL